MTPTLSQVAHKVNEIVARETDDPFEFETRLYGCDPDGVYLLGEDSDPYELIWGTPRPNGLTAVALVATGWASPNYDGVRPSEHPERIRVRIVACKGMDSFVSLMTKADEPDDVHEEGAGEGGLRDALEAWWVR